MAGFRKMLGAIPSLGNRIMIDASLYSYFLKRKNGCYEVHVVEQTEDKGSKRSANPAIAISQSTSSRNVRKRIRP